MEFTSKKNSKTAQLLEKHIVSNYIAPTAPASKHISEKKEKLKDSLQSDDSSPFSFFYSMIPKEILTVYRFSKF